MAKTNNYDVKIHYTEDDIKKVQTKPNLYVQHYGNLGIFHLFKEVAQNSVDENIDPALTAFLRGIKETVKKRIISITYDRLSDKVTVEDEGRGIPEEDYPIDIVCTKLQSGSKFFRDQGGESSGEFGVGITVVNALSCEFEMTTYRMDYFHRIKYKDGEKVEDERGPIKAGKRHGTITSFVANPKYLGVGSRLPLDQCIDWMELLSYQFTEDIEFHIEEYDGLSLIRKEKIKRKPFHELINMFVVDGTEVLFKPVSFLGRGRLEETIAKTVLDKNGKPKEKVEKKMKDVKIEFAFAYDANTIDSTYESFCNFTKTDEGGVHLDSVEDVLCHYLQKQTMNSMTDQQKERYPVIRADVKAGLRLVVNLSTNAQVQFMGNAKNKIQNEALKPLIREIVKKEIEDYFAGESGKLTLLTKIIRTNTKARIDLQKLKNVTIKGKNTKFDDLEISNFIPCNNSKPGAYRELMLIEGRKSAAGSMVDGRDHDHQAIFGFRGQTLNPYKTTVAKFMENAEWRDYIKVIRTGFGQSFDIKKLWYDVIGICTDADIDGYGIGVGIAATHALYLPEIITTGHLYKVYPPLYHIDSKEKPFIGNKGELVELYMKNVTKRYKLRTMESDYFTKDEFWAFLYETVDYRDMLRFLYDFYKVPSEFIEVIAAALTIHHGIDSRSGVPQLIPGALEDPKFIRDFMQEIQRKFPETTIKGETIYSVADGRRCSIRVNYRFIKKISDLVPIYERYGYMIGVKEKNTEDRVMTILDFLNDTYHLTPKIITRFKGLGESNPDQLWETTLNPRNRIMVRLTMENIERDMEIFRKLKSDRLIYRRQRKEMVEGYRIRVEDLDN